MKRMMTNALAIAAAASWVMVAGAQSSTSSAQGAQGEQRGWSETKSMKFTGCLQQGDTPNSFKLTNVQPAEESRSGSTSGTSGSGTTGSGTTGSGTTGSGSASSMSSGSSMMNELELVATGASVDLNEHVGKRVEITGKAAKKESASSSTSGTSGTTSSGSGSQSGTHSGHDMGKKKVQVTAVKSLGGSCSGN